MIYDAFSYVLSDTGGVNSRRKFKPAVGFVAHLVSRPRPYFRPVRLSSRNCTPVCFPAPQVRNICRDASVDNSKLRRSGIVRICRSYGVGGSNGMGDYKYAAPTVLGATVTSVFFREASGVRRVCRRFRADERFHSFVNIQRGQKRQRAGALQDASRFREIWQTYQRHGLRWEAKRHTAFERAKAFLYLWAIPRGRKRRRRSRFAGTLQDDSCTPEATLLHSTWETL
jgi:hypothetical protein